MDLKERGMYRLTTISLMISIVFPVLARALLAVFRGRADSLAFALAVSTEGTLAPSLAPIRPSARPCRLSNLPPGSYAIGKIPGTRFGFTASQLTRQAPFLAPTRELGNGRPAV